jgi:hypothetical protein
MPSLANRVRWLAVPIAAYLFITLALPIANGAARRAGFIHHVGFVVVGCVAVVGAVAFVELIRSWRKQ